MRSSAPDKNTPVAGARVHFLSVTTIAFVVAFVGSVIALILADLFYTDAKTMREVLRSPDVLAAIWLSAVTSGATILLVVCFSVPMGYALSRYRFPGHVLVDTLVDLPIVLPPLVLGVSLLVFFQTSLGKWIEAAGAEFVYTRKGIVLCQFFVSASYGIRSAKAAFDAVDEKLERLAMTLGCTHVQAFWHVALPLARNGVIAGAILAWAKAVGLFGPLMVFAGAVRRKTEVMPTTIFLELSIGRIEVALAVALLMLGMAAVTLAVIHWLTAGRRWGAA
ncbi:MAG: ABC transporter permease [Planctomycetota bacterium]